MKKIISIQVLLLLVWMILPGIALGQVPQLINYQGLLLDPATGQPVPDDTYSITFSIYNVSSGGSAIWSESQSVDTKNGLYSVLLGSTTALTPTILDGPEKYLGINVGDDPEMTPRKRIVSVAYSILSATADSLGGKAATEYATKTELSTSDGDPPNQGSNRVSWDNLTDVPTGFADGVDNTGGGAGEGWIDDGTTVRLESSTDKVGIGTTSPTEVLEVVGNMKSSGKVLASVYSSNSPLIFEAPAGTERARINDITGNFGIGTTSPSFRLEVSDNYTNNINPLLEIERTGNNSASSLRFKNGAGDFFNLGITQDSHFAVSAFNQNISLSSDLLTILNSGNVGIGTTNPQSLLSVGGDGSSAVSIYGINSNGNYGYLGGGSSAVQGLHASTGNYGYFGSYLYGAEGIHNSTGNYGRLGTSGSGVHGQTSESTGKAVSGYSTATSGENYGGYFTSLSTTGVGVYGGALNTSTGVKYGGYFESNGPYGLGVYAKASGPHSIYAMNTDQNTAIEGVSYNSSGYIVSIGCLGMSINAVYGHSGTWAGYFSGDVNISGHLSKGSGSFLIDHPLDPENKLLRHNFVESPENLLIYRGKVRLNFDGEAVVEMPDYFKSLAKEEEATITLTSVGRPFLTGYEWQSDYASFKVYGESNREVSWVVYADRDDPVIQQLARPVEDEKGPDNKVCDRGEFLYPTAYGYPESMGKDYKEQEEMKKYLPKPSDELKWR